MTRLSRRATALATALFFLTMPAQAGSLADAAKAAPIPLMIDHAQDADTAAKLFQSLSGVAPATIRTTGRFTWDVERGNIVNPVGDVVATVSGGDLESQLGRVQGVVDKWTVLRALEPTTAVHGLDTRLEPGDDVHHAGTKVTLTIGGNQYPYFTLINLAADGTINFLYPVTAGKLHDSPTIPIGGPYTLELSISPPFGADHFIAIASATALTDLHAELTAIDGKQEAASILDLFDKYLTDPKYQIGLRAVFSAP